MKRRKLINIHDYSNMVIDVMNFKLELINRLQDDLFQFTSFDELIYCSLKFVKPFNRSVKNNGESIDKSIYKVLEHFGLEAVIQANENDGKDSVSTINNDDNSLRGLYKKWILGIDKLPLLELRELKLVVGEDLRAINKLVLQYEQEPVVLAFINDNSYPRNHTSRTILDFYKRVLRERQTILSYYLEGVYDRALEKSTAKLFVNPYEIASFLRDFPYSFNKKYSFENFDYKNIDTVTHRIGHISIRDIGKIRKKYSSDKQSFYKQLFKKRPIQAYIQAIEYYLNLIPTQVERKPIFNELKNLFNKKKWLAFYALALPQVEGLFSEMLSAMQPNNLSNSYKALPDKVKLIRPNHIQNDTFFDYCQYFLPRQRNRFMHTGLIENYRLNAYDLLIDLEYVLKVFYELDNPYVQLNGLIKKRNPQDFIDYRGYSVYFNLVAGLHKTQKEKLNQTILEFNNSFILKDCQIEVIASEAIRDYKKIQKEFITKIDVFFNHEIKKEELMKFKKEFVVNLKSDKQIRKKFKDFFLYNEDEMQKLYLIKNFFIGLDKNFEISELESEVKSKFDIWKLESKFMQNLERIKSIIENE